jgi:pre-mRNA-processing factor 40
MRKAKDDFENFLLDDRRVLPTMSYSKAERLFGKEDVWTALGESDRREIFEDTIVRVKRKREEDAKELQKRTRTMLVALLDSLPEVNYRTMWAEVQKILHSCRVFKDEADFKKMHKLDMLEAFEDYIRMAEKDHET